MIRIATRKSALALWQAEHVGAALRAIRPAEEIELIPLVTEADRLTEIPISELGGKGLFAKEIQRAVSEDRADIAVHSAKDLPVLTPEDLVIGAFPIRGDCRDALVGSTLGDLHEGSSVATGSNRRRVQLAHLQGGLKFSDLRGNIATRLEKASEFDAIVVAYVALQRLDLLSHVSEILSEQQFVPQVGQGALAIECRANDSRLREILQDLDDPRTRREVSAERAFLAELGGDCTLPAGAHAVTTPEGKVTVDAILSAGEAGSEVQRHVATGENPESVGADVARVLSTMIVK